MNFKNGFLIFSFTAFLFSCQNIETTTSVSSSNNQIYINHTTLPVQLRVTDRVDLDLTYPSDRNGNIDPTRAPYPVILLTQGGLVDKSRYQWLANHFADKGFIVLSAGHTFNLPFFQIDNSSLALRDIVSTNNPRLKGLISPTSKIVIMGHSLGGVVSVYQWLKYDNITGLVLIASYPDEKSDIKTKSGKPVLVISGSNDKKALPENVKKGFSRFSQPKTYAEVKGMNHYGWTDNSTDSELKDDGRVEGNLQDIRNNALNVIDTWLMSNVFNDNNATNLLKAKNFSGVTVVNE